MKKVIRQIKHQLNLLLLILLNGSTALSAPQITRESMAGLWKVTNLQPTTSTIISAAQQQDVVLRLQDNGSFQVMDSAADCFLQRGGVWDYLADEGQLVLAADRDGNEGEDVLLEGRVKYHQVQTLQSGSMLLHDENPKTETFLSVPQGKVCRGTFCYPKRHRAFFGQPMFDPTPTATCCLQQVLANHPPQQEEGLVEKFVRNDFLNKTFYLSSYPLPNRSKKKQPDKKQDDIGNQNIRVLELILYSNYTFEATQGSSIPLRGFWDIFGHERDEFQLQISRFGFGRSVSSTYSEGISHEDAKWFRGKITKADGLLFVKGEVYVGKTTPFRDALFELREVVGEDLGEGETNLDDEETEPSDHWPDAFQ
jgi:hypothetical protein